MKTKDGKTFKIIDDAANELQVNIDTVRLWIKWGFLPIPPREIFEQVRVYVFSDEYIADAKRRIEDYRSRYDKAAE